MIRKVDNGPFAAIYNMCNVWGFELKNIMFNHSITEIKCIL